MRSFLRLLVLGFTLPLAGCLTSNGDPLWPAKSGEQLPFQPGNYLCTTQDNSSNNRSVLYEVKQLSDGADLYYTFSNGQAESTASFHRIIGNDYVMEVTDDESEVTYLYLQLRDGEARFILQDQNIAKEIAKNYNVSTNGTKMAYVDADLAKKFIVELGRHLDEAQIAMSCVHT